MARLYDREAGIVDRWATAAAVLVIAAFSSVLSGCKPIAELQPEQTATVRVGDLAALRVDSARGYSVGSDDDAALTLVKRAEERGTTVYVYRAVAPGQHTFVLTPRDSGPDRCLSCVTIHYFITVVR